ncbi:hypothetical protein T484DRAFT_1923651 [Baffinella frigidus]|nr:hypothetical protein T484DRAFT_1923651 [Cryptophyta sp. CCMP2293]
MRPTTSEFALVLATFMLLCGATEGAEDSCYTGDAFPTVGVCKDVTIPVRVCTSTYVQKNGEKYVGGKEFVKMYGNFAELVTDTDRCEQDMALVCPLITPAATGATGSDACVAQCTGMALCNKDADCPPPKEPASDFNELELPVCCSACEKIFAQGCKDAVAEDITKFCLESEMVKCKTTECSSAAASRPTMLFLVTAVVALFAARH